MSKKVVIKCDCCHNVLGHGINPNEELFMTVIVGERKTRSDYCLSCGDKILKAMIKEHTRIQVNE